MEIVKQKYPVLSESCEAICPLVKKMRSMTESDLDNVELEARYGLCDGGKFISGISRQKMDEIIQTMQESPFMVSDHEWQEEEDFFFQIDDIEYRSRVKFDSDSMSIITKTIRKQTLSNITIKSSTGEDIRISLKKEDPATCVPLAVSPTYVRIKQRKSFKCVSSSDWSFDFTMSWSGRTKDAAELEQQSSDPVFEVECELKSPRSALRHSDEYISLSLLMKMCDFLPSSVSFAVIQK